jgi:pilus assembly protein Flp/PilA
MYLIQQIAVMLHVGLARLSDERKDRGVTAAEYGLILALVAVAIIAGVTALGGSLGDIFDSTSSTVDNATP